MARKTPADAGAEAGTPPTGTPPAGLDTPDVTEADDAGEENEILREARRMRDLAADRARTAAEAVGERAKAMDWKTRAGIGIGSAALLAAVLYANRKKD